MEFAAKRNFMNNFINKIGTETVMLLGAGLAIATLLVVIAKGNTDMSVEAVLMYLGIHNPPTWLVWSILVLGVTTAVLATLSGFGVIVLADWAIAMLNGASTAVA